jgi:RNase H-fold protein (predicted Holliday junction resolvase)
MILAIDPGRKKCGVAIVDPDHGVVDKKVVARTLLKSWSVWLFKQYEFSAVVIGDSAFGHSLAKEQPWPIAVTFVQEKDSTLEARERYWKAKPPAWWLRFIPTTLRFPPVPVDDWAAVILAERYLKG